MGSETEVSWLVFSRRYLIFERRGIGFWRAGQDTFEWTSALRAPSPSHKIVSFVSPGITFDVFCWLARTVPIGPYSYSAQHLLEYIVEQTISKCHFNEDFRIPMFAMLRTPPLVPVSNREAKLEMGNKLFLN